MEYNLKMITIYKSPLDYPGEFVAREFTFNPITHKPILGKIISREKTLKKVRLKMIKMNLFCLQRSPEDDKSVIETWI